MDSTFEAPSHPGEMMPPGHMPGAPTEPPKKNKALIIVLVVVALLLLCCCSAGVAVYVLGVNADELLDDSSLGSVDFGTTDKAPPGSGHLEAWEAFAPVLTSPAEEADSRQVDIAEQVAEILVPGFEVTEVRVVPGGEDDEGYIADGYYVRVRSVEDPSVEIGIDFQAASRAWVDNDASWQTDDLDPTQILDILRDGTEYVYWEDLFRPLREGTAGDDYHELLSRSAADWPGSVISWVDYYDDGEVVEGYTYPTTWEQFSDAETYAGFEGSYELIDGVWEMFSWDTWEIEPE